MPNVGKNYADEIAQMKRTKAKYGLSIHDIYIRCEAYCAEHKDEGLSVAGERTIAKFFAPGSEDDTFTYKTIQPVIAVLSDMDKGNVDYNQNDAALYYEQVKMLTLAVEQKNTQISELEKKLDFFQTQYERTMKIIESLTSKQ